eukprot:TRINITY_DN15059_c0_g1_i1.p2 TRINITY_DN15059_c0_g1~~TRINITY_DN15059_c0_g1_i1.p2  ORF type:complete len:133 (+),score=1.00 TRINITY_DN15059_c0_g1_i1:374-772(+)
MSTPEHLNVAATTNYRFSSLQAGTVKLGAELALHTGPANTAPPLRPPHDLAPDDCADICSRCLTRRHASTIRARAFTEHPLCRISGRPAGSRRPETLSLAPQGLPSPDRCTTAPQPLPLPITFTSSRLHALD